MKHNLIKALSVSLLASTVLLGCGNTNKLTNTLQKVKNNYTEVLVKDVNTSSYENKTIDEIMKNILLKKINGLDTYYFTDVDYMTSDNRTSYAAATHLSRTKIIAVLAYKTNNKKLMDIAIKLTRHWVLSNYRNVNWWHNEIGCNGNLTDIGIILFDKLDRYTQEAFRGKVGESSIYHRPQLMTHEGSNLINYIIMSLKDSVFDNNEEEFKLCNKKTNEILTFADASKEGFMKDGSFHQHSTEMQTVAYGLEAVGNIGKILVAVKGTNFNIPKENLEVISKYCIDGVSGVTHKGYFNFMGLNRAYTRLDANVATKGYGYKELRYFEDYNDLPNKDKYHETLNKIDKGESNFSGIKLFPDSNFIVANIDDVYISFMGANCNGRVTESTNEENRLGYNFAWGNNTCVMDTGKEYYNIAPVWDYSKLPGCTSVNFNDDNSIRTYTTNIGNPQYGNRLPIYYPSDSNKPCVYNFSTFDQFNKDNIAYSMCQSFKDVITKEDGTVDVDSGNPFTITCFTTNEGMVIVGSGFSVGKSNAKYLEGLTDKDKTLYTTVEQSLTDSPISKETTSKEVINGNVIYTCLGENDNLITKVNKQTGTYQRNNPNGNYTKEIQEHNVLTVSYSSVASDKSYAYAIQPKTKKSSAFTLMANSNGVHAIKLTKENKIAACFYDKEATFGDGGKYQLSNEQKAQFKDNKGMFVIFDV